MRALILVWMLINVFTIEAQQLYAEMGTSVSTFQYTNSQGETIDNLLSKPGVNLAIGYKTGLTRKERLYLRLGVSYNGYGAIGSDRRLDNYFEWQVNYAGANVGLDLQLFRLREFKFFLKGTATIEFLVRGTQTINNQVFNLVGEDEFNNLLFFGRGGIGVQYPISRSTSLSAHYSLGKTVLAGNQGDDETLNLTAHQFAIGLVINLPGCNCSI